MDGPLTEAAVDERDSDAARVGLMSSISNEMVRLYGPSRLANANL